MPGLLSQIDYFFQMMRDIVNLCGVYKADIPQNGGGKYFMKKQLQGISLILFGILLILFSMVNPWLPIVGGIPAFLAFWIGLASGIAGLVFSFRRT